MTRDQAIAKDLGKFVSQLEAWISKLDGIAEGALQDGATAHATLYEDVSAALREASAHAEHAAKLMDPDQTQVEDYPDRY